MAVKRAVASALLIPLAVGSLAVFAAANASASTLPTAKTHQAAPAADVKNGAVPNGVAAKVVTAIAEAAAAEAALQAAHAAVDFTANTPAHVADVQAAAAAAGDQVAAAANPAVLAQAVTAPASSSSSSSDSSSSDTSGDGCSSPVVPDSIVCGLAPVPNSDAQFNASN